MTILGAAILDYIQYLKENSKDWSYEPLVVTKDAELMHEGFVTIKERPNNHTSPIQFYIDNPPTGLSSLIKAKTKGHYPRIIELRLAPGPVAKLNLKYWRMNGWLQNETSHSWRRSYYRKGTPVQQDGVTSFKVYSMERITKRKTKKAPHIIHRDVIDLTAQESAGTVARWTALTLDKSVRKTHGLGREKLSTWSQHMAVVLDGRNFMYENYNCGRFRSEIVYG